MNSIIKLFVIAAIIAVIGQVMHNVSAISMNEDQFIICNFEDNCTLINIDEYMSTRASEDLWISFRNNLDTFDIEELN